MASFQVVFHHSGKDPSAAHPGCSRKGLKESANDVLSCAQCGNCVSRCPVYRATGDETFTARGKLLTMKRALETKKIELSKVLPLYFCLHCGRCDEECQVNLKHRELYDSSGEVSIPNHRFSDSASNKLCPGSGEIVRIFTDFSM